MRKRRPRAPFSTDAEPAYFFGAIAGAIAGAAGAAAALGASPPIFVDLPPFTIATGSTLPPYIWKIVISASLRSPLSSNSMWPVAPS